MNMETLQDCRARLRAVLSASIAEQRRAAGLATIGQRLAHVRDCAGESQAVWAERVGLSLRGWQNYEQDSRSPKAITLMKLYELGINLIWLLTGTGSVLADDESSSLTQANGWGSAGECPASSSAKTPAAGARCYRVAGVAIRHGGDTLSLRVSLHGGAGGGAQ